MKKQNATLPRLIGCFAALFALTASAANIVQIAINEKAIPFLLDDAGHVWGFRVPLALKEPVRLPGLERIKKIAPFIALDAEGKVYTWSLAEYTDSPEGQIDEVQYSVPQRVANLERVTQVAGSSNHFFAVVGDREIVEWPIFYDQEFARYVSRYGAISKLIDRKGVKAIAAAPGRAPSGTAVAVPLGLAALFDDGTVMGWGMSASGQLEKESNSKAITLTRIPGATGIAMNAYHTVVLTPEGIPKFWGGVRFLWRLRGQQTS